MATRISPKEKELFDSLRNGKLDDLRTFSKPSNRGMWEIIIDQYPESAHFVYELLQNANDAKATYVKIVIRNEGIVFKHNGTIQFNIKGTKTNLSGHIYSITSIGDSSKDGLNTIGKFGIGFKSVFSYTDTPYIYDDKFWFRIDNYIVPTLLDEDFEGRNEGETLFWLPFKSNNKERCYEEVAKKIRTLDNPILFLDNIESIEWIDEKLFDILGVKRTYVDLTSIPDEVKQLARIGEQFEGYTEEERAGFHDWVEKRRQLQSRQQLSEAELQDFLNSDDSYNYEQNANKTKSKSSGSQTRVEEGARRLRLHLQRERSSAVVQKFKQYKVQEDRDLRCEVCGFSFRETYGKLGVGYAEAHHIRPISERQESTETTFDDLCIVCANCHAMLHKTIFRKQISVENLKKLMKK